MHQLYCYLLCDNMETTIGALLRPWLAAEPALRQTGWALRLIPIDNKSTDNTRSVLSVLGKAHACVRPLAHKRRLSPGGCFHTAIIDFLSHAKRGDGLCILCADAAQYPACMNTMLARIGDGADCVIAARPHAFRLPTREELLYAAVLRAAHVSADPRAFRLYAYDGIRAAYRRYGKKLITAQTDAAATELTYKLCRCHCRLEQIQV